MLRTSEILREHELLRERADKKYGGQVTLNKVILVIKTSAQRYNVGDLIDVEKVGNSTIRINMKEPKLTSRLHGMGKFYAFYSDLVDNICDCGCTMLPGKDTLLVTKV